jgi:SAM-dependent methyltransferase
LISEVPIEDPGSFRDPSNRVFHADGRVLRGVKGSAARDWRRLENSNFFSRLTERGAVVATREVSTKELPDRGADRWSLVLEHERVRYLSYPYEWSFAMLQDAAVLHLELLIEALSDGMTLKDGSAFNVQWVGAAPIFLDVLSFEASTGMPWAGYRQFCQTFLYPLLLQAHRGVPFQPFLRGHVDGLTSSQMRRLLGPLQILRAGVLKHVILHDAMQRRFSSNAQATSRQLQEAGFRDALAASVARSLLKLVRKLRRRDGDSDWVDYERTCTYTEGDRAVKAEFVSRAVSGADSQLVLDLGCNNGTYSRIAAEAGAYVIAVDGDEAVIDSLYASLRREGRATILPLVIDVADPSPGLGWRGRERLAFLDRARPDMVLCLALIHHLSIGRNIPLVQVVDWLRSLDARLVVEFVAPTDPMVEQLLANKPPGVHDDYRVAVFEREIGRRFHVRERAALASRDLLVVDPR